MNLEVLAIGFPINDRLRAVVERRLTYALSRFASRLRRVVVRLDDQNGPRGGVDKRCRIEAVLRDGPHLFAEDRDAKWLVSVTRCAERIGRAVRRRVEQVRDHWQLPA